MLAISGCGQKPAFVSKPEPWRQDDEQACLSGGKVAETPFLVSRQSLGGPGSCGALRPYEMSAAAGGTVLMKPSAILRCPMIPVVERWVRTVLIPAARHHLERDVVELKIGASYSCRPANHVFGARLSEHGHANAIDISRFLLSDGRWLTVKEGWHGSARERAFLRALHAGACREFSTVLGPDADVYHHDHFHFDLARHGRDGTIRICR
ncbi:MAG TPA: extensin family protein [Hyphomicrobiaceae bacterium]|nr:extensin family protein [Hyphomicrobiaceae bacterium]